MQIVLDLNEEQSNRLMELAKRLGVDPTELAKAACNDLITQPADEFQRAAEYVLQKNEKLYKRLS